MQEVEVEGGKRSSLPCPRCDSLDTKFCYYNNYNTSQPRHFCKNCKRYWTAGGSLRNVPIGGTLRKNKKSRTSLSSSSAKHSSPGTNSPSSASAPDRPNNVSNPNPNPNHSFLLNPPIPSPSSSSAERDGGTFDEPTFTSINGLPFPSHLGSFRYPSSEHSSFEDNHVDPSPHYHSTTHQFNYLDSRSSFHGYPSSGEFFQHITPHDGIDFHGKQGLAQANSADVPVAGSLRSAQGSSKTMVKDPHLRLNVQSRWNEEANGEATHGQGGFCPPSRDGDVSQCSGNSYVVEKTRTEEEEEEVEEEYDDDLEDVVNVRYPFDWEQVSEVLFGGTPDFVYLPGH